MTTSHAVPKTVVSPTFAPNIPCLPASYSAVPNRGARPAPPSPPPARRYVFLFIIAINLK